MMTTEPIPYVVSIYMTPLQYATHRQTSLRTLVRWLAVGLPSVKQGRNRRIRWQEADLWIDSGQLTVVLAAKKLPKPKKKYAKRPAVIKQLGL